MVLKSYIHFIELQTEQTFETSLLTLEETSSSKASDEAVKGADNRFFWSARRLAHMKSNVLYSGVTARNFQMNRRK